jgi:hypothetical protein
VIIIEEGESMKEFLLKVAAADSCMKGISPNVETILDVRDDNEYVCVSIEGVGSVEVTSIQDILDIFYAWSHTTDKRYKRGLKRV